MPEQRRQINTPMLTDAQEGAEGEKEEERRGREKLMSEEIYKCY
jgi:hypothetical protein